MSHIVAICGMMGSGKSTALRQLSSKHPDCCCLHEDDFNPALLQSVDQVQAWWERGSPLAEIDLSDLAAELQRAADSGSVNGVVLLETQFGRLHPALRPMIDLQCWIDVEPDLALARKVAQLATQFAEAPDAATSLQPLFWLAEFCDIYAQTTRKFFMKQRTEVTGQSDIVVTGDQSPADVCQQLEQALPGLFSNAA